MSQSAIDRNIKKLGFGLMRPPMTGDEIDMEQVKKMVDTFMQKGFTYFDTAYVYMGGKSEEMLKTAVVDRYPRESFQAASKMPIWEDSKGWEDMQRIFDESLRRTGLDYFDFYLLHSLDEENYRKSEELKAWDFIAEMKKQGKIKHTGFSFHDSAEILEEILTKHPEAEFVQLQINYIDWESDTVQSRKCYETARRHGKPVIIMEPVRGGALANMTAQVQDLFKSVHPEKSIASWAVRYAASLDGVLTVLSGMSNEEQMNDNCSFMEPLQRLTQEEYKVIDQAVAIMNSIPTVPCTACQYCVDGCPMHINIPGIFAAENYHLRYNFLPVAKGQYEGAVRDKGAAGDCIACGACEAHCPQHISIIEELQKAAELFA